MLLKLSRDVLTTALQTSSEDQATLSTRQMCSCMLKSVSGHQWRALAANSRPNLNKPSSSSNLCEDEPEESTFREHWQNSLMFSQQASTSDDLKNSRQNFKALPTSFRNHFQREFQRQSWNIVLKPQTKNITTNRLSELWTGSNKFHRANHCKKTVQWVHSDIPLL